MVFDGLRARLERLLAEHASPADGRARAADLQAALVEAKVAVSTLREALGVTERELEVERRQLADAERRGRLAAEIPDPETTQVAERFAVKHRDRTAMLERKLAAQQEEVALAERDFEELKVEVRNARQGTAPAGSPNNEAAWRDVEAAAGTRPETDVEDALLRHQMDRARLEAAAEAQLAHLKKKLGKEP